MSSFVSCHFFDETAVTIVPVIASFDTQGVICPLYVRIRGASMKVLSYFSNVRYANTIEFRCRIQDGDVEKPLMLTYYAAENMWTIPRNKDE